MKRWVLLLLLFTCAAGWAGLMSVDFWRSRATPASDGSTAEVTYFDYDQSAFADVTIYLSVLDGSKQPVSGLPESAFSITEDDVIVDITGFIGGGAQPVTAVMLIDHSGSMDDGTKMEDAIIAALTFLDHLQDGRDHLGVVPFNHQTKTLGTLRMLDNDIRTDLHERISRLTADGGTAYYDAVYQAVDMLRGAAGRKVVLALTDGIDEHSDRTMDTVIDYAQGHNVVLHTIGLGTHVEWEVLQQMAQETGGQYYKEPSSGDLAQLYTELARSLQDEYSLTYTSPTPRLDGTTRQVEATVQLPGGMVTAVESYAVGGTLTPTLNLWPCLGALPLLVLLALPALYNRVRGRGQLAEPEPILPPPAAPPLVVTPGPPDTYTPISPGAPAVCISCGRALRDGARFCPVCGQPVSEGAPPSPATKGDEESGSMPVCAYCGAPVRPGARFCRACGQPVTEDPVSFTCPHCGAPLQPETQFCANCGQRV